MKYGRREQYSLRPFTDYMGFSDSDGDQDLPDDQDYHSFVASMLERDVTNDRYATTATTLRIGLCHDIEQECTKFQKRRESHDAQWRM